MSTLFKKKNHLNNGFLIPRSDLFLDGDLFSLGDFLDSSSVSLQDLDTLGWPVFDGTFADTDWPSFKLVCTFLDDMAGQRTSVWEQNLKSANNEGMWSVNFPTSVTLIGSPVKRPGQCKSQKCRLLRCGRSLVHRGNDPANGRAGASANQISPKNR